MTVVLWLCLLGACALGHGVEGARRTRVTVAATTGEVPSVEGWKTGGSFTLRVRDASGTETASASWRDPPVITISWVATHEAPYEVECEPTSESNAVCELTVIARGPGQALTARRPGVEAALRNGYADLREWSPAGRKRAERELGDALEHSRALELIDLEIDSLLGLAEVRQAAGEGSESLKLLETAADKAHALGDSRRFVLASARLASSLALLGQEASRPETYVRNAMATARAQDFLLGVAYAHLSQGDIHYSRSELAAAGQEYSSALDAFSRLGNVDGAIDSHLGIGYAFADLSQDAQAKVHFEQARDLARLSGDKQREATALRVLGNVFDKMTQEVEAIRCFEAAQALFEQADDRVALVRLYNGLGEVHGRLNDLPIAIQYHQKAEVLARKTGLRLAEGVALLEIAKYQQRLERLQDAASSYERARSLFDTVGDPAMAAVALAGLGTVAAEQGQPEVGIRHLRQALGTMRTVGEARLSSGMLNDLAEIYLDLGRAVDAREAAAESSRLAVKAADPIWEARSWYLLARAARMEGALEEAQRLVERSLDVGEAVRARVPGHELRALFFEELDSRYRFYVGLLMELARIRPEAAFERLAFGASERGRARALLDRFRRTEAPPTDAERVERERALRDEIRYRALREDLGTREDAEDGAALAERLAQRRRAPGLSSSSQPEPTPIDAPRIEQIQAKLAKQGTLLVEVCLGPERSYLWSISQDRFAVRTLPPREALERQAREVYALLTERQRDAAGSSRERRARAEAQDALFLEKGAALSRALLGPIDDLDAFERLVIASDGLLNYVPISTLPHPRAAPGGEYRPLVLSHEVVLVPSLAALIAIAEIGTARETLERSSRPRVAILADPVFTSDDPRVNARGPAPQAPAIDVRSGNKDPSFGASLRGVRQSLATLPRLLASREEARSIAKAAPGTDVTVMTDFRVSRAAAEEALRDSYEVVHFAAHGILNDEHPALSGIVTSLVDEQGLPQDGFLRAQDVYDLKVTADLVVLSACETALGKMLRGEGITGLVHAFLHAGAHTVVASKWRVDDVATHELMSEFYRHMLVEGASPAAALRSAQIRLFRRQRTRAPFFWGAFEVHGLS